MKIVSTMLFFPRSPTKQGVQWAKVNKPGNHENHGHHSQDYKYNTTDQAKIPQGCYRQGHNQSDQAVCFAHIFCHRIKI